MLFSPTKCHSSCRTSGLLTLHAEGCANRAVITMQERVVRPPTGSYFTNSGRLKKCRDHKLKVVFGKSASGKKVEFHVCARCGKSLK